MAKPTLYHNPACSKSRGALALLRERDVDFVVVEYLERPLDASTLRAVLALLPDPPAEWFRRDKHFAELGLDAGDYVDADAVIDLLVAHPKLLQRPIFVSGDAAVIGRPSERVLELL